MTDVAVAVTVHVDPSVQVTPFTVVAGFARFAFGNSPVTPVDRGSPVALVKTTALGVSRAGVVSDGDVASTGLPVPVAVTP